MHLNEHLDLGELVLVVLCVADPDEIVVLFLQLVITVNSKDTPGPIYRMPLPVVLKRSISFIIPFTLP